MASAQKKSAGEPLLNVDADQEKGQMAGSLGSLEIQASSDSVQQKLPAKLKVAKEWRRFWHWWNGPNLKERVTVVALVLLALVGVVLWLWAGFNGNWLGFLLRLLLPPAALVAAGAAYAHAGMEGQVADLRNKNDKYAEMTGTFERRLASMSNISEKLQKLAENNAGKIMDLNRIITGIERVSDLCKVSTFLDAFAGAELDGFKTVARNGMLDGMTELIKFFDGVKGTVEHNIPTLVMKEFKQLCIYVGLSLNEVALLLAAACSENLEERICMTNFMYFLMDPTSEERKRLASKVLGQHLQGVKKGRFGTQAAIDAELAQMAKAAKAVEIEDNGEEEGVTHLRVPEKVSLALIQEALGVWQVPDGEEAEEELALPEDSDSEEEVELVLV